jgi:hypothetical protein
MSEAEAHRYVGQVASLARDRQFLQVDKLQQEAESNNEVVSDTASPVPDLFDVWLLFAFLSQTPWTCVLILATTVLDVCGDEVPQRASSLHSMAQSLRAWSDAETREAEMVVKSSPSYLECSALLQFGRVDHVGVQPLVELLKLMPQDLEALRRSLLATTDRQLYVVALVLSRLGVMDHGLFSLKALMDAPSAPLSSAAVALDMLGVAPPPRAAAAAAARDEPLTAEATLTVGAPIAGARLVLTTPPVANSVYHKLLKPFPTVTVEGVADLRKCFVSAELFKAEGGGRPPREQLPYLEGDRVIEVKDRAAVFRKLKINTTTTSVGTCFVLRFQLLRKVDSANTVIVPEAVCYSGPLNIFSHSSYLKDSKPVKSKEKRRKRSDEEDSD